MNLTDQQIYDNRLKWAKFLQQPNTIKGTGELENINNSNKRCCLGHACYILGIKRTEKLSNVYYAGNSASLPLKAEIMLGMHISTGSTKGKPISVKKHGPCTNLANLNDTTKITPQEIGKYLESVIMGGDDTPFQAIKL